jgi:hypothetical protein
MRLKSFGASPESITTDKQMKLRRSDIEWIAAMDSGPGPFGPSRNDTAFGSGRSAFLLNLCAPILSVPSRKGRLWR